jgi:transcription elongation factor Elf1
MALDDHDEDEKVTARRWSDFDCPDCNANNPVDESFGNGDEVRCYYCGAGFQVQVNDEGRLRLRPE